MLEIAPARAAIVRCFGDARALDAMPSLGAARARVASDELWLVGSGRAGADVTRGAASYLAGADPDGLVIDHSEGWAAWCIGGDAMARAFARLADFPLPPAGAGFAQGAVVQVPAKILRLGDCLYVIVPVQLGHHVPARVAEACADLSPVVTAERELVPERDA